MTHLYFKAKMPKVTCPVGAALIQDTASLLVDFLKLQSLITTSSSTLAETYYSQFTGWTRVISAPSLATLETKAARAQSESTPYEVLSYGLESSSPAEEYNDPVAATANAKTIANTYSKQLLMAPGYQLMIAHEDLYDDMSVLSDLWLFQTQQIQGDYPPGDDYRAECQRVIGLIRAGHANIPIWAQVLIPPDQTPTSSYWIRYARCIMDLVTGEFIGAYVVWDYYPVADILNVIKCILNASR